MGGPMARVIPWLNVVHIDSSREQLGESLRGVLHALFSRPEVVGESTPPHPNAEHGCTAFTHE